MMGLKALGKA